MMIEKVQLAAIVGISAANVTAKIGSIVAAQMPLSAVSNQDFAAITSGVSILGLAAITLYGKFREERRKQNELDAKGAPAVIASLQKDLLDSKTEAQKWKDICTSLEKLRDTDSWRQTGE